MRHRVVAAAGVMVLAAGLARLSGAEKKPIVAVFKIESKGTALKPLVLERLTIYLASKLSESGVYEVVPQDKLKQALTAKKKESYKQCYPQSCQIEIGQELAADKALATQVMKVGTKCVVTTNIYDLKRATSGKAATAEGKCTEDGVAVLIRQAAEKLTGSSVVPAPSPTPAPRTSWRAITNAKDGSVMVLVPGGSFPRGSTKGSDDERPRRSIHVDAFQIDRQEVTVARYRKCVQAGGCTAPGTAGACNWGQSGRDDHPVNCVDWDQARKYCAWAGGRLPSEAEWDKAARGTDGREYPWGSAKPTCERAVMDDGGFGCGQNRTWPVGSKPLGDSPYGAHDMAGNVWEWVRDWYRKDYYGSSPARNPQGPSSGETRVVRGGSWSGSGSRGGNAEDMRAANRFSISPARRNAGVGFRCVRAQ